MSAGEVYRKISALPDDYLESLGVAVPSGPLRAVGELTRVIVLTGSVQLTNAARLFCQNAGELAIAVRRMCLHLNDRRWDHQAWAAAILAEQVRHVGAASQPVSGRSTAVAGRADLPFRRRGSLGAVDSRPDRSTRRPAPSSPRLRLALAGRGWQTIPRPTLARRAIPHSFLPGPGTISALCRRCRRVSGHAPTGLAGTGSAAANGGDLLEQTDPRADLSSGPWRDQRRPPAWAIASAGQRLTAPPTPWANKQSADQAGRTRPANRDV